MDTLGTPLTTHAQLTEMYVRRGRNVGYNSLSKLRYEKRKVYVYLVESGSINPEKSRRK